MTATAKVKVRSRAPSKKTMALSKRKLEILLGKADEGNYVLRLYITGTTPRSCRAIANIRSLCEEYLSGRYDLEVVDIYQQPAEASRRQIIAVPTLVKELPFPTWRMVGDLSDRDRVLVALDLSTTKKPG
jgi:circadian clock protein KaiB